MGNGKEKTSRVSVRVTDSLKRDLERLAAESRRLVADYVRLALEQHVARKRKAA